MNCNTPRAFLAVCVQSRGWGFSRSSAGSPVSLGLVLSFAGSPLIQCPSPTRSFVSSRNHKYDRRPAACVYIKRDKRSLKDAAENGTYFIAAKGDRIVVHPSQGERASVRAGMYTPPHRTISARAHDAVAHGIQPSLEFTGFRTPRGAVQSVRIFERGIIDLNTPASRGHMPARVRFRTSW